MDDKIAEYEVRGFTVIKDILNKDEISCVQEHVSWLMRKYPDTDPELLEHWFMRDDPFWLSLCAHDKLVDIAAAFLGTGDIALFASHYVVKMSETGKAIHWHQDGSYWPLDPMEVISLWLAVDDSTVENGCMQVVPYSHSDGLSVTNLSSGDFNRNVSDYEDKVHLTETQVSSIENVELKAGSISIHHPMLIHGSLANHSEKRRAGLTLRYIPTTTTVIEDPQDIDGKASGSVFLMRGQKRAANRYREIPAFDKSRHFSASIPCGFTDRYCATI